MENVLLQIFVNLLLNSPWIISLYGLLVYQPMKKKALKEREQASVKYGSATALTTLSTPSRPDEIQAYKLLVANVVMSPRWIQTFGGWFRSLFGGRINTFSKLLDWARREAKQRLVEQLEASGFDEVINVRFETATLTKSKNRDDKTTGFEILVYGTAVKY